MNKQEFRKLIREEVRRVLKESLSTRSKSKAIKALADHLASAKEGGDSEEINSVLKAMNDIKVATDWTEVSEILGQFGFDNDEIAAAIGPYVG